MPHEPYREEGRRGAVSDLPDHDLESFAVMIGGVHLAFDEGDNRKSTSR